jgi:hypothetical protein
LGWTSLLIVHTNPAFEKYVLFLPLRFSRLESVLTENGYLLTTEEPDLSTEPIVYSNVISVIALTTVIVALLAAIIAIAVGGGFIGKK